MRARRGLALAVAGLALAGCGSTVTAGSLSSGGTTAAADGGLGLGTDVPTVAPSASVDISSVSGGADLAPIASDTTSSEASVPADDGGGSSVGGPTPSSLRGVTAKQIRIGIYTEDPSTTQTVSSFGFKGLDIGDLPGNWKVLIADLNKHGGLFGRQIVPVFYEISITSSDPQGDQQKACAVFTQDQPVYAVFSDAIYDDPLATCATKNHLPIFYAQASIDEASVAQLPGVVVVASPILGRVATNYVEGLFATGFLTPKNKIGLIQTDLPRYDRAVAQQFRPAIKRHGLNLKDVAAVPAISSGNYAGLASAIQAAVLRFRADGVDRVMFLASNATEPILWQDAAASQGYYPPEGLTTISAPELLQSSGSKKQLVGAQGVGWIPTEDVTDAHDPGSWAARKRCHEIMAAGGQTDKARSAQIFMESACDMFFLFTKVSATMTVPSAATAYVSAIKKLGRGYPAVMSFGTDFTGRIDGPSVWRPFAWDEAGSFFKYTGGDRPLL